MARTADAAPAAACFFERLAGARSIYRIEAGADARVFAAKWHLVDVETPPVETHDAFLACRSAGSAIVTRHREGLATRRRPVIGAVTYVNGGSPASWSSLGACDVWHVYLAPDALRRVAEADLGLSEVPPIAPLFAAEEPWLKGFFQMIASEFERSAEARQRADALFAAQAEHLLIHHLLQAHAVTSPSADAVPPEHATSALRAIVLKRVQEYVAENLRRDLDLAELAEVACMSSGHFVRSFRRAAGTTPYRYVLQQRQTRAREMLLTTALPVSDIATACGFKTAAHLSAKFHAMVGATPSQFRRRG